MRRPSAKKAANPRAAAQPLLLAPSISTKLSPPRMGTEVIRRERFDHRIADDPAIRLAVVCGPAGFGKTTLMLQWWDLLRARNWLCGWLTLDAGDNDFSRFLTHLLGALNCDLPMLDDCVVQLLSAERAVGRHRILAQLLDYLDRTGRPAAMFLDEFETVTNPEVCTLLRGLIDGSASKLRFIVGTRSVLKLGQARLRMSGGLLEVGSEDLRFQCVETKAFVAKRLGKHLAQGDVAELHRRTDGWAAALQVACLLLHERNDARDLVRSFSSRQGDLADYLAEDVLERQSAAVRDFLLATSVLTHLTGSLCDAVTGQSTGDQRLAELQAAGMFLRRIDTDGSLVWYSYHNLFAEFLQAQLALRLPHRIKSIHRAAADWFCKHGRPTEAAQHARQAGDIDRALALIDLVAMDYIHQGWLNVVIGWAEDLKHDDLVRYPQLYLAYIWALSFARRYDTARATMERLQSCTRELDHWPPEVRDGLIAFDVLIPAIADDFVTVRQRVFEALRKMSSDATFEYGVVSNVAAHCRMAQGEFSLARDTLAKARASLADANSSFGMAYARTLEGITYVSELHLRRGQELLRGALEQACAKSWGCNHSSAVAAGFLAETLYEANQIDVAHDVLQPHLALIAEAGIPDAVANAFLTMARIRFVQGDQDEALALLEEGESVGFRRRMERVINSLRWELIRFAQLRGNFYEADRLASTIDQTAVRKLHGDLLFPVEALVRDVGETRVAISTGQVRELKARLHGLSAQAGRQGFRRRKLKLDVLYAIALSMDGDHVAALRVMTVALQAGVSEGFVRTYLDEGPVAFDLIRRCRAQLFKSVAKQELDLVSANYDRLLKVGEEDCIACNPWLARPSPDRGVGEAGTLLGDITEREIEVLEFLSIGFSNRDIAGRLAVSETTVKWHLRNIFGKLGVANRTQAVFSARQANLIQ